MGKQHLDKNTQESETAGIVTKKTTFFRGGAVNFAHNCLLCGRYTLACPRTFPDMRKLSLLIAVTCVLSLTQSASAGIVLGFGWSINGTEVSGAAPAPQGANGLIGDILSLDVYAIEVDTPPDVETRLTNIGLEAFDITASHNTDFVTASNPSIPASAGWQPGFSNGTIVTPGTISFVGSNLNFFGDSLPVRPTAGSRAVLLSSVDFSLDSAGTTVVNFAPSVVNGQALTAIRLDSAADDPNTLEDEAVLDDEVFPGGAPAVFTITVSAVPEPSTVVFLITAGAVGLVTVRRRRRKTVDSL